MWTVESGFQRQVLAVFDPKSFLNCCSTSLHVVSKVEQCGPPRTATGAEIYNNALPAVQKHDRNDIDRQSKVEKTKMVILPLNQATRCVSDSGDAVS